MDVASFKCSGLHRTPGRTRKGVVRMDWMLTHEASNLLPLAITDLLVNDSATGWQGLGRISHATRASNHQCAPSTHILVVSSQSMGGSDTTKEITNPHRLHTYMNFEPPLGRGAQRAARLERTERRYRSPRNPPARLKAGTFLALSTLVAILAVSPP